MHNAAQSLVTPRPLLRHDARRIGLRLAAVDHDGQPRCTASAQMGTEILFLPQMIGLAAHTFRRFIKIIQPRLAQPHDLGVVGRRSKIFRRNGLSLFRHMIRMHTNGAEDILIPLRHTLDMT